MALHFERREYKERIGKVTKALAQQGLEGLLMFNQESMYYLTGYDSFGFCFFQCLYLGTDGRVALLTRLPDLRQARHTSIIEDIRVWTDQAGANPASDLKEMILDLAGRGKSLGIETNAYGLTHFNGRILEESLSGACNLTDASNLVSGIRLVKSKAELAYVRKAGKLGDLALQAAIKATCAGAKARYSLRSRRRSSPAAVIIRPMNSLSAQVATRSWAATNPAAASWRSATS
ncbi:MAG: aminopeptidase P family N-terminal domain-containing protein [Aestuariivirgaceae bacterium]